MTRRLETSQWHDRTEEPVIIWAYTGVWDLVPVAVDGSDVIIYVVEETSSLCRRESLDDALPHLDPEDVAEMYREMLTARR